ncbi:MAG: type II TA system antitoxin MqsA family protein, partial [Bacilli bacterium]
MSNEQFRYCESCQSDVNTEMVTREAVYTFKGETFEIEECARVCESGHDLYDPDFDSSTIRTLTERYEERIGFTLGEIITIRHQYGLSQELFAKILGWSKSSIVRYESGTVIPDQSHVSVLKLLKEQPEAIRHFFNRTKHRFTKKEQTKIQATILGLANMFIENGLDNLLQLNYKPTDYTVEAGYVKFNIFKLREMILYFSRAGVEKQKLMKLLFYTDFLAYKRNTKSISGLPYMKMAYGPMPKDPDLILAAFERKGWIRTEFEQLGDYMRVYIYAEDGKANWELEEHEKLMIEHVGRYFFMFGAAEMSEFSHGEIGWLETDDR